MFKNLDLLNQWGPVYWNRTFYRWTMALLYDRTQTDRLYQILKKELGGKTVLELCCGDAELSEKVDCKAYIGIDKNPSFVNYLNKKGISLIAGDVLNVSWPIMDCVVIKDSLYHFLPKPDGLFQKMNQAGIKKKIIVESTQSWTARSRGVVTRLAQWATRVDGRTFANRFTEETLQDLFREQGFQRIIHLPPYFIGIQESYD